MFFLPERADWIIWSTVRSPGRDTLRKTKGDVIDHLGFVEGVERLVVAARGDDGMGGMGISG
jgi:hypothetical protein